MKNVGISLYLGTGLEKNAEILKKAHGSNIHYAFTSLQIPEEKNKNGLNEIRALLTLCKDYGVSLIADIGPYTLRKLGIHSFEDLKQTAISHLRVDNGISCREMVEISKYFNVVLNASTLQEEQISELQKLHADFSRFSGCHNFYPEPLTGLSVERVKQMNERMHRFGMKTMAFVAGDKEMRGPLYQGLPTLEGQRNRKVLLNILQLFQRCATDVCLVGDVGLSDTAYRQLQELNSGYVSLKAKIKPEYRFIAETIHHDRPDSSEYVIRSQESRQYQAQGKTFPAEPSVPRKRGCITLGNQNYLRYAGELEIARRDLPQESRVNPAGFVEPDFLPYLDYVENGMGFRLVIQ